MGTAENETSRLLLAIILQSLHFKVGDCVV